MYHFDPAQALTELEEEAALPNPVYVRDMIMRAGRAPHELVELNRRFKEYLDLFGKAQDKARSILKALAQEEKSEK